MTFNTTEQRDNSLRKLADWKNAHPGRSDSGMIRDSCGNSLEDDEPEREPDLDGQPPSSSGGAHAVSQPSREDSDLFVIAKILQALSRIPDRTLSRLRLRENILDRQVTASKLDELIKHPLMQKYVVVSQQRTAKTGPVATLFTLRAEALEYPEDLGFVFGQRREPKKEEIKPEVEQPFDYGTFVRVQHLVRMPYREFLQQSDKYLCPLRNLEQREAADFDARWHIEFAAWPEVLGIDQRTGQLAPKKQRPAHYWDDPNEVTLPDDIREFDGSPLRKPTPLFYSPQNPGQARLQQRYVPGSEEGDVRPDWERRINGW